MNGAVLVVEPRDPGAVAAYSCNSGYSLDGGRERLCLVNGVWEWGGAFLCP